MATCRAHEPQPPSRGLLHFCHEVVMKRGSPRTMKTCLPTRCRGGPAGPPRADAWVGPYLSFSEQTRRHQEGTKKRSPWSPFRDCSGYTEGMTLGAAVVLLLLFHSTGDART